MSVFKIEHGDFNLNTLICTRSATLFIDTMRGLTQESLGDTDRNGMILLDKMVAAIYYCHKSWCEDEDIPVQVKRSEIFDRISYAGNVDNSNIEKFMSIFAKSMEDVTAKMTEKTDSAKKKKPSVTPTIS